EPPGGDPLRAHAGSRVWNRGKRSVTLDIESPAGSRVLERLIDDSDVLIETFAPGTLEALGLGFDGDLPARHPQLIRCSITGYGRTSSARGRPAYDALIQARMGMHFEQPSYRKDAAGAYVDEPVFLYVPLPSYGAMLIAVVGVLAALHARTVT